MRCGNLTLSGGLAFCIFKVLTGEHPSVWIGYYLTDGLTMTADHPAGHGIERRGTLTIVEGGAYSPQELSVAHLLAQRGYQVVLRPPIGTRVGGETSDLLLDGHGYDIYTPTTVNPNRIISAIAKKNAQAEGVVLDLSATSVTLSQLGNVLERVRGAGATNIRDVIVLEEK